MFTHANGKWLLSMRYYIHEGQSVLDGLEVRVAFGNVWKESPSELSGGQRYHISEKRPYLYEFD